MNANGGATSSEAGHANGHGNGHGHGHKSRVNALRDLTPSPSEELNSESLQALVQRAMFDDGLSQKETAQQIGVSQPVFNQWLGAKYSGDNSKIDEKVRRWMKARGERIQIAHLLPSPPAFFESETAMRVISHLRVAQMLQDMLMVFGVPGVGKSSAARHYQRTYPNVWIATASSGITGVVPVLQEICDAMLVDKGNGARRHLQAICSKARGSNGLLIVDEAHHLTPAALDAIRSIHDATGVAIALLGGKELHDKMQRMPQFSSRLGLRLFVTKALTSDVSAQLDAWNITRKQERAFLTELAKRDGALRTVNKVIRLATMTAASASESPSLAHFKDAAFTLSAQATEEE